MAPVITLPVVEQHFTITHLKKLLDLSYERVRQLVMDEPGVLVLPPSPKKGTTKKRTRNTYRIPASVLQRIMRRYANPMAA